MDFVEVVGDSVAAEPVAVTPSADDPAASLRPAVTSAAAASATLSAAACDEEARDEADCDELWSGMRDCEPFSPSETILRFSGDTTGTPLKHASYTMACCGDLRHIQGRWFRRH